MGIYRPAPSSLSGFQQFALVALRILIGWHFLYEGYYKLVVPAWASDGTRLGPWTAEGYLAGATGSVGRLLHALFAAGWGHAIDLAVIAILLAIGLSLILGAFTQAGCVAALVMLGLFYITSIPLTSAPQPGQEGHFLIVDRNLVEFAAVLLLWSFRLGRIAGLDAVFSEWRVERRSSSAPHENTQTAAG
ncbi:MAG TPA: hypothetical protein VKX41_06355 [Alloacidobacterium sp.]|nr:hypothetical protein [Alloacidobacterium sp.]